MNTLLFLDDEREPTYLVWYEGQIASLEQFDRVVTVRDFWEFKRALLDTELMKSVAMISLDHDLGQERTGYDCACMLEHMAYDGFDFSNVDLYCHSANPVGANRIRQTFARIREMNSGNSNI